jgi:hypothetical protein
LYILLGGICREQITNDHGCHVLKSPSSVVNALYPSAVVRPRLAGAEIVVERPVNLLALIDRRLRRELQRHLRPAIREVKQTLTIALVFAGVVFVGLAYVLKQKGIDLVSWVEAATAHFWR